MSRRDEALLGVTATTFLLLCLWLGPDRAVFLIAFTAIGALWIAACKRWPFVGYATVVFLGGFISGLLGSRRRRW